MIDKREKVETPKRLTDMMVHRYDGFLGREEIEWSNFWYSSSNVDVDTRYLFVGDSTLRMLRGDFERATKVPVDFFASSSSLHDEMFIRQMDCFFSVIKHKYDVIFVQLGSHSRCGESGEPYQADDYEMLRTDYSIILDYLRQFGKRIIVEPSWLIVKGKNRLLRKLNLYRLGKKLGLYKEPFDEQATEITRKKNRVFKSVAEGKGIEFFDINAIMDRTYFVRHDHIHYEDIAKAFIVEQMLKILK